MDSKDWLIVALLIVAVGGPFGVHLFHTRGKAAGAGMSSGGVRTRDKASDATPGGPMVDDGTRLGVAIGKVGGRALVEGAKAAKQGPKQYGSREHGHEHLHVGGAV